MRHLLISSAGLIGAAPPGLALWRTWLVLDGLYGGSALLGPGLLVTATGFGLTIVAALLSIVSKANEKGRPRWATPSTLSEELA